MALRFCSFSSGSSGNCYMVATETTVLLVDAGISARKVWAGLETAGLGPSDLKALLLTHEHGDHVRSVRPVVRKAENLEVYANRATWEQLPGNVGEERRRSFVSRQEFTVGDLRVRPFPVSHDAAEPVGFSFFAGEKQLSIVTDTGCVGPELLEEIRGADLLVLEANHDADILRMGPYPYFLKQRILGEYGHLSNEAAGRTLLRLLEEGTKEKRVLLGHLSRENNFPEMAGQTVKNILEEKEYYIGRDLELEILKREEASRIYEW
ncbi:MAG: MBL fold metallo-hydrolase [Bacillota bacterium]|nr:MBL fold metallo-hydrolase [Bacillota bacterium]